MNLETLKRIEGLQTVETVMNELHYSRQSSINLLSKLKKEHYLSTTGGGKQIRLYKITVRKQPPRKPGMWDILNKYNPVFQLIPWYDHQVYGKYGAEEALIDAIQTKDYRIILASLKLFNHIKDWTKIYRLAKEKDCWQKVGVLYDLAKIFCKTRSMPQKYQKQEEFKKQYLFDKKDKTIEDRLKPLEKKWNIPLPFKLRDFKKLG